MLKASKHEASSKIRSRHRAVADYDVDRPQVQAWRHVQPSGTNCPNVPEKRKQARLAVVGSGVSRSLPPLPSWSFQGHHRAESREKRHSGDDSIRAPPLPIPNREVKPYHADGTAKAGE